MLLLSSLHSTSTEIACNNMQDWEIAQNMERNKKKKKKKNNQQPDELMQKSICPQFPHHHSLVIFQHLELFSFFFNSFLNTWRKQEAAQTPGFTVGRTSPVCPFQVFPYGSTQIWTTSSRVEQPGCSPSQGENPAWQHAELWDWPQKDKESLISTCMGSGAVGWK